MENQMLEKYIGIIRFCPDCKEVKSGHLHPLKTNEPWLKKLGWKRESMIVVIEHRCCDGYYGEQFNPKRLPEHESKFMFEVGICPYCNGQNGEEKIIEKKDPTLPHIRFVEVSCCLQKGRDYTKRIAR